MTTIFTTRIGEDLVKLIDEISREECLGRSTVVRRFLTKQVKEWLIERSLEDYKQGKVTLWQAAERCGLSLWEMVLEAKKREIHVTYTLEEFREDLRSLQQNKRSIS